MSVRNDSGQKPIFEVIDQNNWKRKPYFDRYFTDVPCTYSITVNIDISEVIRFKAERKTKLYPLLIYILTKAVHCHDEFRMDINENGEVGVWKTIYPCYTVFHKENETFSCIWTEWNDDLKVFLENYNRDVELYGNKLDIDAKPQTPKHVFPISSLPWTVFTGFNLNIKPDTGYLLPIFTFGKYFKEEERFHIPLSIQVHHAVCDGYHVSRFIHTIQKICSELR